MFRTSTRVLGGAVILSLALSAQTFTTLYNFGSYSYDGSYPFDRSIIGPHGELYGTTEQGGEWGLGTVYELLPPASAVGAWSEVVLHSFNGQDGHYPNRALVMGPGGALFGVIGGSTGSSFQSTVFELDPPTGGGAHWPFTIIYRSGEAASGLVFGLGHALYGSLYSHVFSLTPPSAPGGTWTETNLRSGFTEASTTLAVSSNGTLFGVTNYGGRVDILCSGGGCGAVFSVTPPGVPGGPWTERVLYAFNPQIGDGHDPDAGVVLAPTTGVLYGTTGLGGGSGPGGGTVFSLSPPASPGMPMTETTLHVFTGPDGAMPNSVLVLGPNGVLYGTTRHGGIGNHGTVFQLTPPASPGGSWTETTLHSFTGGADGKQPVGLALGSDGKLYGITWGGGILGNGTAFSLMP